MNDTVINTIINAKTPEQVFGKLADEKTLKQEFRRLSRIVHPDMNGGAVKAETAFNLLVTWHGRAKFKLDNGTYGDENALANTINIVSKRGEYYIVELIKAGDLANVYLALDKNGQLVTVKAIRSHTNNDLGRNELTVIKAIEQKCGTLPTFGHIPMVLDSFQIRQDGAQKQVNVFRAMDRQGGWVTVEDVLQHYPEGIDLRDAAWMFNRLLGALLVTHQSGYIHGAVTPSHVMLHLPTHNGVLIDWSYAVKEGQTAKAVTPEMQDYMPSEILAKKPLSFGTDLFMAAKILLRLVGGENELPKHPPSVRGLFRACLLSQNVRLNDVNEVYEDFSKLLNALYGPRKFRTFKLKV